MAPLAILGLSVQELVIILLIVVVLFGARRIPEIMRGLGQGVSSFKKGIRDDSNDSNDSNVNKGDDGDAADSKGPSST